MRQVVNWIKTKQNSLVGFITAVLGFGELFDLWHFSEAQTGGILAVVGAFFVLIGANVTTSNMRPTGRAWSGFNGATENEIADSPENILVLRGTSGPGPGPGTGR